MDWTEDSGKSAADPGFVSHCNSGQATYLVVEKDVSCRNAANWLAEQPTDVLRVCVRHTRPQ